MLSSDFLVSIGLDYCVYSLDLHSRSFTHPKSFLNSFLPQIETWPGCCPYIEIPSLSPVPIYCGSFSNVMCIWYCSLYPNQWCSWSCLVKMNICSIDFLLYFFIRRTLFFYSSCLQALKHTGISTEHKTRPHLYSSSFHLLISPYFYHQIPFVSQ